MLGTHRVFNVQPLDAALQNIEFMGYYHLETLETQEEYTGLNDVPLRYWSQRRITNRGFLLIRSSTRQTSYPAPPASHQAQVGTFRAVIPIQQWPTTLRPRSVSLTGHRSLLAP